MAHVAVYIALGANLPSPIGAPRQSLKAALAALAGHGIGVVRQSRWYRSPAWPDPRQPEFVNAVAEVTTTLEPAELLTVLHRIEAEFGRVRRVRNAPRTLDLDLLDYGGRVENDASGPILPHPRLAERAFVLRPLAEIAPSWRHPVSRRFVGELLAALPENAVAEPLDEAP